MAATMIDTDAPVPKVIPFFPTFQSYLAMGDQLYQKGHYSKAIESYSTGLILKADDKHCLAARSRCFLKMGDPENALRDAEASLKDDKTFYKGLYRMAEALNEKGDFESALAYYHRGRKLRPNVIDFKLGIQKAEEPLEKNVKAKSSRVINHLKTDQDYIEKLLRDQTIVNDKTGGGKKLKQDVRDVRAFMDARLEFWKHQRWNKTRQKPPTATHFEKAADPQRDAWRKEKEDLIKERQVLTGRFHAAQQKIRSLEEQLKVAPITIDNSTNALTTILRGTRIDLTSKDIHWEREQRTMKEAFLKELRQMEARRDKERREIQGKKQSMVKEKHEYLRKFHFTRLTIKDLLAKKEHVDHVLQHTQSSLLYNLGELERNFFRELHRREMVASGPKVLKQCFAKLDLKRTRLGEIVSMPFLMHTDN